MVENYTDDELKNAIQDWTSRERVLLDELENVRHNLQLRQAELARRKLEAFWQQNAGLRLAVGDALLVTEEAIAVYGGRDGDSGKVITISSMELVLDTVRVGLDLGARWISLPIARRMRLAYLQAHGEAVE